MKLLTILSAIVLMTYAEAASESEKFLTRNYYGLGMEQPNHAAVLEMKMATPAIAKAQSIARLLNLEYYGTIESAKKHFNDIMKNRRKSVVHRIHASFCVAELSFIEARRTRILSDPEVKRQLREIFEEISSSKDLMPQYALFAATRIR